MIGLGPHTMTAGDWAFIAAIQVGLIALAVLAVCWAAQLRREGRR